ncbi:unnamed protein product, partial [Ectocarpus sp. 13 AM-2016]
TGLGSAQGPGPHLPALPHVAALREQRVLPRQGRPELRRMPPFPITPMDPQGQERGGLSSWTRTCSKATAEGARSRWPSSRWPRTVTTSSPTRSPSAVCGDPEQTKPSGSNTYSTASSNWESLATYRSGHVLEFVIVMNARHWGHLVFFICNADNDPDGIPTQECFNQYPLTRVDGDDDNGPIDPNFPGRYYCDPTCRGKTSEVDQTKPLHAISGENMKMRYVLPDVECSHCIMQMVYRESGCFSCFYHIGYEEFNPSSWPSACGLNKEHWVDTTGEASGQRGYSPEEFWACSDFSIARDTTPPGPTPSVETIPPVNEPTGCAEEWGQCGGAGEGAVDGVWTGPTCWCLGPPALPRAG